MQSWNLHLYIGETKQPIRKRVAPLRRAVSHINSGLETSLWSQTTFWLKPETLTGIHTLYDHLSCMDVELVGAARRGGGSALRDGGCRNETSTLLAIRMIIRIVSVWEMWAKRSREHESFSAASVYEKINPVVCVCVTSCMRAFQLCAQENILALCVCVWEREQERAF